MTSDYREVSKILADDMMAEMQPTNLDKSGDSDSNFLPVADMFEMMTAGSEIVLPTSSLAVKSPSATISSSISTTSAAMENTEESTTPRIIGPGPESMPAGSSTAQSMDHDHPAPIHKLVVIGSVMGGIIAFTLLSFLFFNRRAFRREKTTELTDTKIVPFYQARKDFSTDSLNTSAWPKFPPPSATYQKRGKQAALLSPRVVSKVLDITHDFPRSKFSVTSSDYVLSPRSSTNSTNASIPSVPIVGEGAPFAPPALLPPNEFFTLPSSPDLRRSLSSRHSRNHSAPIFGHYVSPQAFLTGVPSKMRAGDHRKSKSISGLVYAVGRRPGSMSASSHRRSTSSKFSQYKGTPPTNGLLSAPDS